MAGLATTPAAPDRVNPEALRATLAAAIAKWRPPIKAAGIYAD